MVVPTSPYNPEGRYQLVDRADGAEVFFISYQYVSELRVRWLPDDAVHHPLNHLLAHISVLELDHLAVAVAAGQPFTVDALDEFVPRPGWELESCMVDDPSRYALQQLGAASVHYGSRRDLLLLVELMTRSAIAPHVGQPPPRSWVQRLRDAHPQLLAALGEEAVFEWVP